MTTGFFFHPRRTLRRRNHRNQIKFQVFRTPLYTFKPLFEQFPHLVTGSVLDPCAGDLRYLEQIVKSGNKNKHMAVDINPIEPANWQKSKYKKFIETRLDNFITTSIDRKFDNAISNPPFAEATQIVDKCLELVHNSGYVTMLQRIDWVGTQKRSMWLCKKPLRHMIIITKRPIFEIDGRDKNSSDSRDYCFFVFQKGYKGEPDIKWLF